MAERANNTVANISPNDITQNSIVNSGVFMQQMMQQCESPLDKNMLPPRASRRILGGDQAPGDEDLDGGSIEDNFGF